MKILFDQLGFIIHQTPKARIGGSKSGEGTATAPDRTHDPQTPSKTCNYCRISIAFHEECSSRKENLFFSTMRRF